MKPAQTLRPWPVSTASVLAVLAAVAGAPTAHADRRPALSIDGFVRLDMIIDDSPMSDIRQPQYVLPEADPTATLGFSLHPRLSRIGLNMEQWRPFDVPIFAEGRFEVDFQGDTANAAIRLRHAFFTLDFRKRVELLAGHTWDLYSPLFPATNNETLMWNAGNTGARRPQLRLTVSPTDRWRLAAGMGQTGGLDTVPGDADLDGSGVADSAEPGAPMLQWLLEYRERVLTRTPTRIGIWGHLGHDPGLGDQTVRSWSIGAHLFLPLSRRLTFLGEIFHGRNLDDIRGAIGQGINPVTGTAITATGGWWELAYVPTQRHMLAAGLTMDVPRTDDLEDGARDSNVAGYLVTRYRPSKSLQLGVEYNYWRTGYKNGFEGTVSRFNLHVTLSI